MDTGRTPINNPNKSLYLYRLLFLSEVILFVASNPNHSNPFSTAAVGAYCVFDLSSPYLVLWSVPGAPAFHSVGRGAAAVIRLKPCDLFPKMPLLRPQIDASGDHGYGSIFLPLLPQQRFTSDPANLQTGAPALAAQERFRGCRPQPTLGLCPRMFRLLRGFHSPFPPHFAPFPRPAGLADPPVFRPVIVDGKQRRPPRFPYPVNQKRNIPVAAQFILAIWKFG